ncbi:unnamed protein product [Arabidopsis halleri]
MVMRCWDLFIIKETRDKRRRGDYQLCILYPQHLFNVDTNGRLVDACNLCLVLYYLDQIDSVVVCLISRIW